MLERQATKLLARQASADATSAHPATPRLSASLMIVYPLKTPASDGYNYRILLLQRTKKTSFSSAYVFPGGNVDRAADEVLAARLVPQELESATLRICAIRETFEECGILLARDAQGRRIEWPGNGDSKLAWRERVHDDASQFAELLKELDATPSLDLLAPRANWTTPVIMPTRWDTTFYWTILPPVENDAALTPEVVSDGKETVLAAWYTPREAVEAAYARKIILAPPQVYLLAELIQDKDYRALLHDKYARVPRARSRLVINFTPRFATVPSDEGGEDVFACLYPGDAFYEGEELASVDDPRRHRLYMLPAQKNQLVGIVRKNLGTEWGVEWSDFVYGSSSLPPPRAKL
ncbi:uncharacterized protein L969DRAFT_44232 [Mixia osmundae IAM 14324]|uniref:Nudix hydrolase domain-containing protein n=1 Tax=Mixia osmundae (strain CBS 9802 / IAM 14324 / JCM 22182 / KY 12970) TaxID=764103 RepID=G7DZB9_MIXOS|nr:uncharacterized protein L969DRAFT_44232 [Mixia osmundae IAM 14324]KEI42605.1 hypothetical protein L969DRAFT_44232 [Mixia osmundae IAM 14324]GAA95929.1 hypothetical protein E5Q_02587 [Mixia osmundae IAM 14324]